METELSEEEKDLIYLFRMNDIMKIIKLLEDSVVLIDGVDETVKHERKSKKVAFLELC